MRIFQTIFVSIFILFSGLCYAGPDIDEGEIKTSLVRGTVYILEGTGGNVGLCVGEDGVFMVDDKFAPLADSIKQAVEDLGFGKIRFILNTHWHGDHTGGNEEFGTEATIIAQENVRKRLSKEQFIKFFNKTIEPLEKEGLPVITFPESITIYLNGEEIDIEHFDRGHTDGDSVVFFRNSNVVHVGDLFFNGSYPYIDLDSGGDVEGYILNVKKLIELIPNDTIIIPGHGPVADKEDFKVFYNMLLDTTEMVKDAIKEGKTLDEIKDKSFPEEVSDKWGNGFLNTDQYIAIIYNYYTADNETELTGYGSSPNKVSREDYNYIFKNFGKKAKYSKMLPGGVSTGNSSLISIAFYDENGQVIATKMIRTKHLLGFDGESQGETKIEWKGPSK